MSPSLPIGSALTRLSAHKNNISKLLLQVDGMNEETDASWIALSAATKDVVRWLEIAAGLEPATRRLELGCSGPAELRDREKAVTAQGEDSSAVTFAPHAGGLAGAIGSGVMLMPRPGRVRLAKSVAKLVARLLPAMRRQSANGPRTTASFFRSGEFECRYRSLERRAS